MAELVRPRDVALIVDDSPETLGLLTEAIERAGVSVLVATSGQQALATIERVTPDVILMDAVMPGMDGFETCRRMKANNALSHVPVIFMTGLSETQHILEGLEAGGVDYLTKPISIEELLARIRVHLANARRVQSAHVALDAAGRYLLAVDADGRLLWFTPQAMKLIAGASTPEILPNLATGTRGTGDQVRHQPISLGSVDGRDVQATFIGKTGSNEFLYRIIAAPGAGEGELLRRRYGLTAREAEVLVWIGRGKPNRDIADILGLSPRTVNKHLEQIYVKLGVENRASAAILALRALGEG